jgi:hypothetical protein
MRMVDSLTREFNHEAQTTRKHLERLPSELDPSSWPVFDLPAPAQRPRPRFLGPSADERLQQANTKQE